MVNCQISWVDKDVNSFDDEIQWILQFGYSKVLVIVADNYRITVRVVNTMKTIKLEDYMYKVLLCFG